VELLDVGTDGLTEEHGCAVGAAGHLEEALFSERRDHGEVRVVVRTAGVSLDDGDQVVVPRDITRTVLDDRQYRVR